MTHTGADEDDDFDDLPERYLEDEAYDDFVAREFDAEGRIKRGPPVTLILVVLIVVALAIAFVASR